MSDLAERLLRVEVELARLSSEHDALKVALGDPRLTAWVGGGIGRIAPRKLTTFEAATARRLAVLQPKISTLQTEARGLVAQIVFKLARKKGDGLDDPEVLLRAAFAVLTKTARGTPEGRAVVRAIADYLKSLAADG